MRPLMLSVCLQRACRVGGGRHRLLLLPRLPRVGHPLAVRGLPRHHPLLCLLPQRQARHRARLPPVRGRGGAWRRGAGGAAGRGAQVGGAGPLPGRHSGARPGLEIWRSGRGAGRPGRGEGGVGLGGRGSRPAQRKVNWPAAPIISYCVVAGLW